MTLKCPYCGQHWTRKDNADIPPKDPCPWCEWEVIIEEAEELAKQDIW